MWSQSYYPLGGLVASALLAAVPVILMLYLVGVARKPAWVSGLIGALSALLLALFGYHMPWGLAADAAVYGAAYGLLPIGWIVFTALLLYRLAVETGQFAIIKDSIGHLTSDTYMQALLIAFAFGAFIEGASGFGSPVAVASAMLVGLGMPAFDAAAICLLANTAPVAFGAIGTPLVSLQSVTSLPMRDLSADVGRICAPLSLFIPIYLIMVMGGKKALAKAGAAAMVCGAVFATTQFLVSSFVGPYLTDILSSLSAIGAMVVVCLVRGNKNRPEGHRASAGQILLAWSPYIFLVIFVMLLNGDQVILPKPYDVLWPTAKLVALKAFLSKTTVVFGWPGLHNMILRVPPVVKAPAPYAATYTFNPLTASGTAALYAVFASAIVLRVNPMRLARMFWATAKQLALPTVTIVSVLSLAYLMNYSGATATLGLSLAHTGVVFPFFSAMLGWMGKMISLQSIAVAGAATGLTREQESNLMRFTVKHSIFLAAMIGLVTLFYTYVMPGWVR